MIILLSLIIELSIKNDNVNIIDNRIIVKNDIKIIILALSNDNFIIIAKLIIEHMENISSKIVSAFIEDAIKNGKSNAIEVEDSQMPYFRLLITRYNKANGTKLSIRGVHGVYREICAPFDRFFDSQDFKPAFNLIQNTLIDANFRLSEDDFLIIKDKLKEIERICEKQVISNKKTENVPTPNNLLG